MAENRRTYAQGDRVERIPVIQAILRKVAVAAANGNTRAQQNYLSLLIGAEADRRVTSTQLLKTAIDYKERWHHVLAERALKGTTGPESVPHPDEVIIDHETGDIRIDGPVLEEQKEAQNLLAYWRAIHDLSGGRDGPSLESLSANASGNHRRP